MEAFLHQVFAGLATGSIYAALALALVMTHQSTHQVNFAQGEMAMFSTYLAWTMVQAGSGYWPAFLLTLAISFAGGVVIERVIVRPVGNAAVLALIMVFVALLVILNSLAGWIWSYTLKTFPSPFEPAWWPRNPYVSAHEAGTVAVTLGVVALLWAFFRFTTLGLAMRAAASNPASSRLCGVRVGRMTALGWGLAAAIGAVAGMLIAPVVYLDPGMMSGVFLYALAAALLGGIDNPAGAVFGGLAVGVIENLAGTYLFGTELKLTVALALIVGVLLFKPAGIFGRVAVARV